MQENSAVVGCSYSEQVRWSLCFRVLDVPLCSTSQNRALQALGTILMAAEVRTCDR